MRDATWRGLAISVGIAVGALALLVAACVVGDKKEVAE